MSPSPCPWPCLPRTLADDLMLPVKGQCALLIFQYIFQYSSELLMEHVTAGIFSSLSSTRSWLSPHVRAATSQQTRRAHSLRDFGAALLFGTARRFHFHSKGAQGNFHRETSHDTSTHVLSKREACYCLYSPLRVKPGGR